MWQAYKMAKAAYDVAYLINTYRIYAQISYAAGVLLKQGTLVILHHL